MAWETFRRTRRPSPKDPTITLSKIGMIGLNTAVCQLIGDCRYALLMFDKKNSMIGIKFLKNNEPDAYPVGVLPKKSHGSMSGVGFLKAYGIMPTATRAFPASYDEKTKMLVSDISDIVKDRKNRGET